MTTMSRAELDALVEEVSGDLDLPLPSPASDGSEWIDAYRHWSR